MRFPEKSRRSRFHFVSVGKVCPRNINPTAAQSRGRKETALLSFAPQRCLSTIYLKTIEKSVNLLLWTTAKHLSDLSWSCRKMNETSRHFVASCSRSVIRSSWEMGLGENRQYKTHLYPVIVTRKACQGVFQYAHLSHAPRHNETHLDAHRKYFKFIFIKIPINFP